MAKVQKFLGGWYRLSGEHYFSNIKLERSGEWSADVRYSHSGELFELGSLHSTKRDAIEDVSRVITRLDDLFVEQVSA